MKTRILAVVIFCAAAGTLAWLLYPSPPAPAAKTADAKTPAKIEAPKLAAPLPAPTRSAQVAQPVVAAATSNPAAPTPPADETFVAEPKTDLKACVSTMIHFLQTQDIVSLIKTAMPPDAISQMIASGQASSVEDVAAHFQQMPDISSKISQLLQTLQSVQGQEPEISADGKHATYKVEPGNLPPDGPGNNGGIEFVQVDGFWYLR